MLESTIDMAKKECLDSVKLINQITLSSLI